MEQDPVAALLAFPPVPVRARRDGWTPERQRRFVLALLMTGVAAKAARMVGMSEQGAARLRARPGAAGFDAACRVAAEAGRHRRCQAAIARERLRSAKARRRARESRSAPPPPGPPQGGAEGEQSANAFFPMGSSLTAQYETSAAPPET